MPTISVYQPEKDWLASLKTASKSRDSYAEVLQYVRNELVTPPSPPPVEPTVEPLPWYLALVVPRDRLDGLAVLSPAGTYNVVQGIAQLALFGRRMNEWMISHGSPYTFNFKPLWIPSRYTLEELQTRPDGTIKRDEFGEGIYEPNVILTAPQDEASFELAAAIQSGQYRVGYIVVGGGRVDAGATLNGGKAGYFIGGDEDFSPSLTGNPDPAMVGSGDEMKFGRAKGHEFQHANGAYCHAGNVFNTGEFAVDDPGQIDIRFSCYPLNTGDVASEHWQLETWLYPGQVAQWVKWSKPWLRPV